MVSQNFHYSRTRCQICLTNHDRQYTSTHPATCPQRNQHRHRQLPHQLLHSLQHNLVRYKHLRQALQAFQQWCLNRPRISLFPQIHRQMLHTLRLSCKPVKSANKFKSNRLSTRVVFQSLQRWTFGGAPFRTYFVCRTRILLATTTMHVIATSIPKPSASRCRC